ncbi:hypothetical protein [Chromobacterium sp. ASV23]|nr:hypothetical protein [Chromobacterium sp. ASV23]
MNQHLAMHYGMTAGVCAYAAKYMLKCKTEAQLVAALDEYRQLPPALNQH